MRRFIALVFLVLLPPIGFSNTIWIPDGQEDAPPGEVVDLATEEESLVEDAVPDGLSTEDWSSIREAYEAGRLAVYAVEGGYQARNPEQQWLTRFDGRGFTVEPDAGGWMWGLELVMFGFPGNQQVVTKPESVRTEGGQVA